MADGRATCRLHGDYDYPHEESTESWLPDDSLPLPSPLVPNTHMTCNQRHRVPDVHRVSAGVRFIARHTRILEDSTKVSYCFQSHSFPQAPEKRFCFLFSMKKIPNKDTAFH